MENNIKMAILNDAKECIKKGKISEAETILKAYLDYNPKDPEISVILAKIYFWKGKQKEALDILKRFNGNYFCIFEEQVEIYIKLQKYDKLYNLWKKNKDRKFQDVVTKKQLQEVELFLRRTQILLKTLTNKKIEIPTHLDYKEEQYLKYDYKKAINHIRTRHTSPDDIPNENTSSIFYKHYDIEELFLAVSRNIDINKKEITLRWKYSDTYIFNFKKIGRSDNNYQSLDFFRVATIPNTNKIITMYPLHYVMLPTNNNLSEEDIVPICNPLVRSDRVYREKIYSINKK